MVFEFLIKKSWAFIGIGLVFLGCPFFTWAGLGHPPHFIENKNQWGRPIDFGIVLPGGNLYVSPGRFHYVFMDQEKINALHEQGHELGEASSEPCPDEPISAHAVIVDFLGANYKSVPIAFGKLGLYYNFYQGQDPSHWASHAEAFEGMLYPSLYSGIDMKAYVASSGLKYDFYVGPGADPSMIRLQYHGAVLDMDNGNLLVNTSIGSWIEKRPYAWQILDGKKIKVECEYVLSNNQLSFYFPNGYDACETLVIDPLLIFSTYSGSTADNWGSSATPGEKGKLYSSGVTNQFVQNTFSGTFPTTVGAFQVSYGGIFDIGILKYDSLGRKLLYASYLGGSDSESPHSLVMDTNEDLIVLGTTSSSNFPVTASAFDRSFNGGIVANHVVAYSQGSDIFVARIKSDGSALLASTFIGGSSNDGLNPTTGMLTKNYGDQLRGDVITDAQHNVYVSTVTASMNFPVVDGFDLTYNGGDTDALLMKLSSDLSQLIWATYLGGNGADASHTLKFDRQQNIYLAGGTASSDFPITQGSYQSALAGNADGWIAKVKYDGKTLLHTTLTGTSSFDQIYFLDLNTWGEIYVYGQTAGTMPITPGVYNIPNSGQFIQKFDSTLSTLKLSTVFGSGRGIPDISPTAFMVNDCNNIYLAGWGGQINNRLGFWLSNTTGLQVSDDAYQKTSSGSDFYFLVLTDDAARFLYGTYLGGDMSRTHVDGGTSRFDKGGVVYHAVCSGCEALNATGTPTSDFPTTPNAWSRINKSKNCNNAAFKFDLSSLKARLQTNSIKLKNPGMVRICMPDTLVIQNKSTGGEIFTWNLGDGTTIVKTDTLPIYHQYAKEGNYKIKLKLVDQRTCKEMDSTEMNIVVFKRLGVAQNNDEICGGSAYTLKAGGGVAYRWFTADKSFASLLPEPLVTPAQSTVYYVKILDINGCERLDTVSLRVVPVLDVQFSLSAMGDCFSRPNAHVVNLTQDGQDAQMVFDFGDGNTSDLVEAIHTYEKDGSYPITLTGIREFCIYKKTISFNAFAMRVPNVITPGLPGFNDVFEINYGEIPGMSPADYGLKVGLRVYNRWGKLVYSSEDYRNDWSGESLASGTYYYYAQVEGYAPCKSWLHILK